MHSRLSTVCLQLVNLQLPLANIKQLKAFVTREVYHVVIITKIRVKKMATRHDENIRMYSGQEA
jgi:hypothetical protein